MMNALRRLGRTWAEESYRRPVMAELEAERYRPGSLNLKRKQRTPEMALAVWKVEDTR